MIAPGRRLSFQVVVAAILIGMTSTGCVRRHVILPAPDPMPRELNKVTLPEYVIEPPDILQIDALSLVPLPPYRVRPLDALAVVVPGAEDVAPIAAIYTVEPDGTINLGPPYGAVNVDGMTLEEAKAAIEKHLSKILNEPATEVSLAESRGVQQIRGPHLVRQDGTIGLGQYGSVYVTGLTLMQAKARIEAHLQQYLKDPEVTVDVLAYNSKVYYVILDGGGIGQSVFRQPITGNETVLDAIGQVNGLGPVSDRHRIWIARPGPDGCETILPVDWNALTMKGATGTNYQILPGDRLYVQAYPMVSLDSAMARVFAPFERLFGITLLGQATVRSLSIPLGQFGGFGGFGF
jgi:polysaccharide export outer membrane protein